jgi:hypothetical protein
VVIVFAEGLDELRPSNPLLRIPLPPARSPFWESEQGEGHESRGVAASNSTTSAANYGTSIVKLVFDDWPALSVTVSWTVYGPAVGKYLA